MVTPNNNESAQYLRDANIKIIMLCPNENLKTGYL